MNIMIKHIRVLVWFELCESSSHRNPINDSSRARSLVLSGTVCDTRLVGGADHGSAGQNSCAGSLPFDILVDRLIVRKAQVQVVCTEEAESVRPNQCGTECGTSHLPCRSQSSLRNSR